MRPKPTSIRLAVCAALGVVALAPAARAAVLPNGVYLATINPTPLTAAATPNSYLIIPGTDGAWNSSFSFSKLPKRTSQKMFDNNNMLTLSSGIYGSSKLGDGAGSWDMTVTNGTFTTSHFQVDAILTTAGGTFVEYGSIKGGTIDQTTGAMTLDPTGRLGAVGAGVYNAAWNIPDVVAGTAGTTYAPLITGTSTNADGSVTGHGIVSNGDGTYNVILASASAVGEAWGSFDSTPYVEAWNVTLKPLLIAVNDTASAQPGAAKSINVTGNDKGTGVAASTIVLPSSTSANGAALTKSPGKVEYTALASYTGTDTFTYELQDSSGTTPPATVTVTVAAGVTASPDTAKTPQGKPVTIDVLKNDSGASSATVAISKSPGNGTAVVNSSNQVTYTPNSGFVGTDTFQYTDTASGKTSTATVTVTVNAAFQAATSGVSVGPGAIAKKERSFGLMTTQQLVAAGIPADAGVSQQCIGGCFDFTVTGMTTSRAEVAMLPLTKPIPSDASLRKYINGKWQNFVTSNGDSYASAPGSATLCPPPSSTSYQPGLTAGDYCVRLAITDNGPNDDDGTTGVIADPSGIATGTSTTTTTTTDFKGLGSGGCALGTDASPWHGGSWWLIGAVIGWLGFNRRRRSSPQS